MDGSTERLEWETCRATQGGIRYTVLREEDGTWSARRFDPSTGELRFLLRGEWVPPSSENTQFPSMIAGCAAVDVACAQGPIVVDALPGQVVLGLWSTGPFPSRMFVWADRNLVGRVGVVPWMFGIVTLSIRLLDGFPSFLRTGDPPRFVPGLPRDDDVTTWTDPEKAKAACDEAFVRWTQEERR